MAKVIIKLSNSISGGIQSVTDDGNTVVGINNTDPNNPVVIFNGVITDGTTIGGSGTVEDPLEFLVDGGAVDSVNGKTGVVVLDADDIPETATKFWLTDILKTAYDSTVTWITTNGTNILNHLSSTSNPHSVTKSQVGLGNVDNTSDIDKIVSTATQTALDLKQDDLSYPSSDDKTYGVKNGVIEELAIGSLLKEQFEFTASQTFTLANNYAQVYSVMVSGQGSLHTSQYDLVAPNQVEILDDLEAGDFVIILYSTALAGTQPYYTQAQVDALLSGLIPRTGTTNPIIGNLDFNFNDDEWIAEIGLNPISGESIGIFNNESTQKKFVDGNGFINYDNLGVEINKITQDQSKGLGSTIDHTPNITDLDYVQKTYVKPHNGTGTDLPTDKIGGYFGNMQVGDTANSSVSYNLVGNLVVSAFGVVRVNRATQPVIVGATLIDGAAFVANINMHMVYQYFGTSVQYYFLRL